MNLPLREGSRNLCREAAGSSAQKSRYTLILFRTWASPNGKVLKSLVHFLSWAQPKERTGVPGGTELASKSWKQGIDAVCEFNGHPQMSHVAHSTPFLWPIGSWKSPRNH